MAQIWRRRVIAATGHMARAKAPKGQSLRIVHGSQMRRGPRDKPFDPHRRPSTKSRRASAQPLSVADVRGFHRRSHKGGHEGGWRASLCFRYSDSKLSASDANSQSARQHCGPPLLPGVDASKRPNRQGCQAPAFREACTSWGKLLHIRMTASPKARVS